MYVLFGRTMGEYIRNILNEITYYGTIFPRIPVTTHREIKMKVCFVETTEYLSNRV